MCISREVQSLARGHPAGSKRQLASDLDVCDFEASALSSVTALPLTC